MNKDINRVRGALYGVAVGDALGAPLEFMDAESIRQKHGTVRDMIGGGWLNVKPGEVTDDTQMTLCVAHGIVSAPHDPVVSVGVEFLRWVDSRPKDIGSTCASAISNARYIAMKTYIPNADDWSNRYITHAYFIPGAYDWLAAALATHNDSGHMSAGNGSLMRTVYTGLYYDSVISAISKAERISQMTHYDPRATSACAAYSAAIYSLVREDNVDKRRLDMCNVIESVAPAWYDCSVISSDSFTPNPSGYVVDSFAAALHCICTTSSFEEAIVKAVNLGGDADTIGAITGGLAGALYGYEAIPQRWTKHLSRELLEDMEQLTREAMKDKTA